MYKKPLQNKAMRTDSKVSGGALVSKKATPKALPKVKPKPVKKGK